MKMFGNKEETQGKEKTAKELMADRMEENKRQKDLLVALRTESELKLEKSAIVTLSHITEVIRSQSFINKKLSDKKNNLIAEIEEITNNLDSIVKKKTTNVDEIKFSVQTLSNQCKERVTRFI